MHWSSHDDPDGRGEGRGHLQEKHSKLKDKLLVPIYYKVLSGKGKGGHPAQELLHPISLVYTISRHLLKSAVTK